MISNTCKPGWVSIVFHLSLHLTDFQQGIDPRCFRHYRLFPSPIVRRQNVTSKGKKKRRDGSRYSQGKRDRTHTSQFPKEKNHSSIPYTIAYNWLLMNKTDVKNFTFQFEIKI